ncbi:MAG: efflux RND transporter permease subunit, partial [Pseudomonadota bacterium]
MSGALETVLSRPKTVLTMMLVLVMGGIMSYIGIPKEANPDIDVPVFYVSIGQQGLSPEDGVRLIARPMETELRSLDGLKEITTIAAEGHVGVLLEFTVDFDKDEALADIRDKVDAAQAEIPEEADEPRIIETNFALQPTIIVTLSGDVPERTLHRHAQLLSDEIEAISTVLDANLSGNRDEMLEVVIDQMRLESYDISQDELVDAVTQNNQLVAAGFLDTGNGRFNVKVPGLFETVNDISSLPIKVSGDGVVTLGDVADLRRTFEDPNTYTRVNGEPAISIQVRKRIGTNIIANNADVVETVNSFTADWPDAIKVGLMLDQSSFIFEVLGNLEAAILTAIALVMIVVVAALGMRSGILVGLAIPTSFLVGFLILSVLGMTVNMMVMFGMVLTVGILVDGAIVITEYADRKMSEGLERSEAYKRAAKLMLWPIVSSTATTLAAFLPMLLWPGVPGEFMSYLPIMVIIVLSAALMTAMVFLPTLGIVLGDTLDGIGHHAIKIGLLVGFGIGAFGAHMSLQNGSAAALAGVLPPPAIYMLGGIAGMLMLAAVTALIRFVAGRNRAYDDDKTVEPALTEDGRFNMKSVKGFSGLYIRLLQPAVKSVIGSVLVVGAVVFVAFSVLQAFTANNNGVEFFVEEEPDLAIVLVSGRGNMSALENRDLMIQVERELLKVEGIS